MLTDANNGIQEMNKDNNHGSALCRRLRLPCSRTMSGSRTAGIIIRRGFLRQEGGGRFLPPGAGGGPNPTIIPSSWWTTWFPSATCCQSRTTTFGSTSRRREKGSKKGAGLYHAVHPQQEIRPYPPDVMHFDAFRRGGFMLLAGCSLGGGELFRPCTASCRWSPRTRKPEEISRHGSRRCCGCSYNWREMETHNPYYLRFRLFRSRFLV